MALPSPRVISENDAAETRPPASRAPDSPDAGNRLADGAQPRILGPLAHAHCTGEFSARPEESI